MQGWTKEEDGFLRKNYATMNRKDLCERLGRTWQAIKTRARKKLKLKRPRILASTLYFVDGTPKYKVLSNGCWQWISAINAKGYPTGRGGKDTTLIYRQIWIDTHGPIRKGWTVDHLCKNRACINLQHLQAVIHKENVRRGKLAKLTVEEVKAIRSDKKSTNGKLALKYNVSDSTIDLIKRRQTWR